MVFYYYNFGWIGFVVFVSIILCIIRARRAAAYADSLKTQNIIIAAEPVPMQPYPPNNPYPPAGIPGSYAPAPALGTYPPMTSPTQQYPYQQQQYPPLQQQQYPSLQQQQQQYPPFQQQPAPQTPYQQPQTPYQQPQTPYQQPQTPYQQPLTPHQEPQTPYQAQHVYPMMAQPAPAVTPEGILSPPPLYSPAPTAEETKRAMDQAHQGSGVYDKAPEPAHHVTQASGESSSSTQHSASLPRPPQGPQSYN
ncbi:hypothetical protein BGZ54_007841 [Gamsiella multidivaricata]|nr:hypothetical protein BGZ54_007841 [Gamsiella multidivaricata]